MCRGGACFSLPRPLAGATFRPTALTAEVYTGAIGVSLMSRIASLSFIFFLIAAPSPAAVTGHSPAAHAHRERHPDRVRLRQQHLGRRTRRAAWRGASPAFRARPPIPHFSPDGKWLAFSAEYAGNTDVYVVPSEGGEPKRLTWHPGADTGGGLDARRQVGALRFRARHLGAQRGAALLDRAGSKAASKNPWRCLAAIRARSRPTALTSPTA